jgi:hypothetical protein
MWHFKVVHHLLDTSGLMRLRYNTQLIYWQIKRDGKNRKVITTAHQVNLIPLLISLQETVPHNIYALKLYKNWRKF